MNPQNQNTAQGPVAQPIVQNQQLSSNTITNKELYTKYFPIYLLTAGVSIALVLLLPLLDYLIAITVIVFAYRETKRIKAQTNNAFSSSAKMRFTVLSGFGFLIAPIVYSLALRNAAPEVSKFYSRFFGKMALPLIIGVIVIGFIIGFAGAKPNQ